eukprot:15839283-Heterocapsa_arctica.AAC.1
MPYALTSASATSCADPVLANVRSSTYVRTLVPRPSSCSRMLLASGPRYDWSNATAMPHPATIPL